MPKSMEANLNLPYRFVSAEKESEKMDAEIFEWHYANG